MTRNVFVSLKHLAQTSSSASLRYSFNQSNTRKQSAKAERSLRAISIRKRIHASASNQEDDSFKAATTEEEWLKLDEKVNKYPCDRTFKAIGVGGQDFAERIVTAVERATSQRIDRRIQVVQRPSKEGRYLAVSVRAVSMDSGKQVLEVFREIKASGGSQLRYII